MLNLLSINVSYSFFFVYFYPPKQALRAAADVIPAGTEGWQFLLPTPAPRPFHFAPVVPTVVRSIFGAPHLGGGLGVPMRPEAATRWLQLTDPVAAQYVTLRHVLRFPEMSLATQQTAVADRTKYDTRFFLFSILFWYYIYPFRFKILHIFFSPRFIFFHVFFPPPPTGTASGSKRRARRTCSSR